MQILKLNSKNLKEIVQIVIKSIKEGKVIVFPTDTVYGLVADATNEKAVGRIFKIKKRPKTKPIPIFVKGLRTAKKLALINKNQEEFLKQVWPGKVTVILKPKRKFPKGIGKPKKEIGLRSPKYKIINQLLKLCNRPLTGTSANISGKLPSAKIKEILKQFKNRASKRSEGEDEGRVLIADQKYQPDLVISAGNLPKSKPSIVLDLRRLPPKILRL